MNNIEIKIWANPQGFGEVTRRLPSVIFSTEEKKAFNPDSYYPISTPEFFSIFYAQNSYVVNYHFFVSVSRLQFRDNRTILSIAIPRGYSLGTPIGGTLSETHLQTNLMETFVDLKSKYEDLLNQLTDINELSNVLTSTVQDWIAEYSSKLVFDSQQPFINIPGTTTAKGYVLYGSSEELQYFLEAPVRMEFNRASLMLLLPVGAEKQNAALLQTFSYVEATPKYQPKFSVYFPAYQHEPIAIIYSLDETIEMIFEKAYCEPIRLSGSYKDNIHEWKIIQRTDNTGYNIGLLFEEKECRYKINVTFVNLKNHVVKANNVSSWLQASPGHIVSDENGDWLVLKGTQNDSLSQIKLVSNREDYLITQYPVVESQFNIRVDEVFYFDVLKLKSFIEREYHFSPQVCLLNDTRQWIAYETNIPLKGNCSQHMVKVAESEEYEEVTFNLSQKINQVPFRKKQGTKLTILFDGEILRWLKVDESRRVTFTEETLSGGKSGSNIPLELSVNLSNNELELPPFSGNKRYCFKAPGFKTEYRDLDAKTTEIKLNMHKVWWKKFFASKIPYMLACLIVGYFLGCYLPFNGNEQKKYVPADTLNSESSDSLQNDEVQDTATFKSHDFSQPEQQNQPEQERQESKYESPVEYSKPVQPQEDKKTRYSSELSALMEKLKGIEFTKEDVDKAKELAKEEGQFNNNKKLFKACDFALRVVSDKNKNASYVNKMLNNYTLQPEQETAILKLIEDGNMYNSDTKKYQSLKEMLNTLNQ